MNVEVHVRVAPVLDAGFVPASLWNRAFRTAAEKAGAEDLALVLRRPNGSISVFKTKVAPHKGDAIPLNEKYVERLLKFLLWQRGGYHVTVAGNREIAEHIKAVYSPSGARAFDYEFMGERVYGRPMVIDWTPFSEAPEPLEGSSAMGRHLDGCRIGFDLGGSDRKCSAVVDGKTVFTEEIVWDPYFQSNPDYHYAGINETLKRAAAKLPRVDAIGGSAAGVYVDNEVRVASLFRGVSPEDFEKRVRRIFFDLQKEWNNVPFVVVNDGEVTALAASMSLETNSILGIAMGTSQAVGYVTPTGNITDWLNELAFAPVDYREDGPIDEWSGEKGAGAQFFSQQAVARLAPKAGIELPQDMPLAERLVQVQRLLAEGDKRAQAIFETIGVCFGYALAHYADFYEMEHVLILGRVTSGAAGEIILAKANEVLSVEFPELVGKIELHLPDEKSKRHGQAVAAASLPAIV